MLRFVLAAAAAAAVGVGALVATAAPALAGNLTKYDGASWYDKYLAVSGGTTPVCSGNSRAPRASSPSATTSTRATNPDRRARPSSRSTRQAAATWSPGRTRSSACRCARWHRSTPERPSPASTFRCRPPRTRNGFDFGSDPGLAFDSNGNVYYSYIVVFFSTAARSTARRWRVARSSDGGLTWNATYFAPQTGVAQFNDKPMITGRHRAGPPQPHLRRVGQRNRQLLVDEERQQRRRCRTRMTADSRSPRRCR